MEEYTYKRTTFRPYPGEPAEECMIIDVSGDGSHTFRVNKFYHMTSRDTTLMTEFCDGDFNSQEELDVDFEKLTPAEAYRAALGLPIQQY